MKGSGFGVQGSGWRLAGALLAALLVGGCAETPAPKTLQSRAWNGPTDDMGKVLAAVDVNNRQIQTLWANVGYFEANVVDPQTKKKTFVNGDQGTLQLRKPLDLRMRALKPVAGVVLDVGSDGERFWLSSPAAEKAWWGLYRNVGKPCASEMPIRPDLMLEVLGITDVDSNFMQPPMPVMKFINDVDMYQVTWVARASSPPDRLVAVKEVWYYRESKLPGLVNLIDQSGRIILSATLEAHQPVEGVAPAPAGYRPAMVATKYRLYFPESGSTFRFTLKDVALTRNNFPNDASFRFDPNRTGANEVTQVDAQCERAGRSAAAR